jgi:hypothetical protein
MHAACLLAAALAAAAACPGGRPPGVAHANATRSRGRNERLVLPPTYSRPDVASAAFEFLLSGALTMPWGAAERYLQTITEGHRRSGTAAAAPPKLWTVGCGG